MTSVGTAHPAGLFPAIQGNRVGRKIFAPEGLLELATQSFSLTIELLGEDILFKACRADTVADGLSLVKKASVSITTVAMK